MTNLRNINSMANSGMGLKLIKRAEKYGSASIGIDPRTRLEYCGGTFSLSHHGTTLVELFDDGIIRTLIYNSMCSLLRINNASPLSVGSELYKGHHIMTARMAGHFWKVSHYDSIYTLNRSAYKDRSCSHPWPETQQSFSGRKGDCLHSYIGNRIGEDLTDKTYQEQDVIGFDIPVSARAKPFRIYPNDKLFVGAIGSDWKVAISKRGAMYLVIENLASMAKDYRAESLDLISRVTQLKADFEKEWKSA